MIHTPAPTLHREIRAYLGFLDIAREPLGEVQMPATYSGAVARAELIRTTNPETPGPGRYEGNDDRILAEMLDELTNDYSYVDEQYSDETGYWCCRIGRFTCDQSPDGFFSYHDCLSEPEAEAAFAIFEASLDG
jgi:hypothetical protein